MAHGNFLPSVDIRALNGYRQLCANVELMQIAYQQEAMERLSMQTPSLCKKAQIKLVRACKIVRRMQRRASLHGADNFAGSYRFVRLLNKLGGCMFNLSIPLTCMFNLSVLCILQVCAINAQTCTILQSSPPHATTHNAVSGYSQISRLPLALCMLNFSIPLVSC